MTSNIMSRRIKLPRHSLIYREDKEGVEESSEQDTVKENGQPEFNIVLTISEGTLDIFVDIDEGFDVNLVGALVGGIATAEIFQPVLTEVTNCLIADDRENEVEFMQDVVRTRIDKHRHKTLEEMGRKRPVVEPIGAIRNQITMYQQPSAGE